MSREIDQEGTVVIKIHPDESDQEFPCDMCKNVFTEMSSLELHIATEHLKQFSFGSSEASNVHKQSNLIEHLNKQDENNFEVKTLFQTDQVDNTDEYEFDRDKFEHDDENKELGDDLKIKPDVKTILEMDQKSKKDFGKYSKKQLKAKGVLVQVRTYKNPTELPLKNDKTIQIKAGQKVCFYKFGLLIHLITEGM